MCDCGFPHDDLDDAMPSLGNDTFRADFNLGAPKPGYDAGQDALLEAQLHYEPCKKCGGTGRFVRGSFSGQCFTCKGKGKFAYKQSAEVRAAKRAQTANAKQQQARSWIEQNATAYGTLIAKTAQGHRISADLLANLQKYGSLTDRQTAMVKAWAEEDAKRLAEREQREAAAPEITVEKIEEAFNHAREAGLERLVLRLDTFKFKPAPSHGKNAGAIYVTEDGEYLGKIAAGKFVRVRTCTDDQQERIVAAAGDPAAAAVAYGRRFGICSCCGLKLTNALSIELGIGPICRSKWGMA